MPWDAKHLRLAIKAAGVGLWSWKIDSERLTMDERALDLWGISGGADVYFEELFAHIHPSDRDKLRAAFAATRATVGTYEIDFRIMIGEELRWISARGQGDDADIADRTMFGVFLMSPGRKQAEEGHELLSGEMSHRVKNLLHIASGLTAITSRSSDSIPDMARQLTHRLVALGRAHDLVRPTPDQQAEVRASTCWGVSLRSAAGPDIGGDGGQNDDPAPPARRVRCVFT